MDSTGKRNRLVVIQRRSGAKDAWGKALPDAWEDVCNPWAEILNPNGAAAIKADAEQSSVRASIRIGYRTNITAAMRVVDGTDIYDIKVVLPDKVKRKHVDLVCELVT